jgi:hypothetical protein
LIRHSAASTLLALLYALLRLLIDLVILRGSPTTDRDLELLVLRQELLVLELPGRNLPGAPQTAPGAKIQRLGERLQRRQLDYVTR